MPLKSPLFRKEGVGGDLTIPIYRKLISPTSLQKRGFFMMLLLVILLEIYLIELRTENVYRLLSSPSLQKKGFFMILLLVILLGIYLRELRTESIYLY